MRIALLISVAIFAVCGCNRVAPQAAKGVGKLGRAGADDAEAAVVKAGGKSGRTDGQAAEKWLDRAETGYDIYNAVNPTPSPQEKTRPRFPHPLSSVVPVSADREGVPGAPGYYALANNYGGVSIYDSQGRFVRFSARNTTTGGINIFDGQGYLVR